MKKYRFFYHYNKSEKKMTVHYKKQCIIVNNVWCDVACNSKWNKTQPYLIMQGWAEEVFIDTNNCAIIR